MRGQQPDTDEAVPRIEFDFADLGREEDQVLRACQQHFVPRKHSVSTGGNDFGIRRSTWTQCGDAALRPRARVGTVVEGCAEQTSQANTGETWSESQPSVSRQD